MGLILFIYLAGITSSVSTFSLLVGLVTCVAFAALLACGLEMKNDSYLSWAKRMIAISLTSFVLTILTPSKDTMYLMAGAYGATEIAKHESVSEIPAMLTKTMKLINQELDSKLAQVTKE